MSSATVSVLLPVYNAERYLAEAVDSILAQTCDEFELVAIDDGSTDESSAILDQYALRDDRVRIVRRANTGIVGALNDGLAEARGEFIARMDADDVAMPQRLARQLAFMRKNRDVVAVGCGCLLIDKDDDPFNVWGQTGGHDAIEMKLLSGVASALVHSSAMFRTAALHAIGGYRDDVGVSEDLDLYLRLAEHGRLANIPDVLMTVRRYDESTSGLRTVEQRAASRHKILSDARRRRGLPESELELTSDTDSLVELKHRRAMQAFKTGHGRTSRKYAWQTLRLAPFARRSWSLLFRVYFQQPRVKPLSADRHVSNNGHSTDAAC